MECLLYYADMESSLFGPKIDVDQLINAVKARPQLYKKSEKSAPKFRQTKSQMWRAVCKELNSSFDDLAATDKLAFEREVYKRWRSLRCCFGRELALQKKEKVHPSVKRRKIYEHFDSLQFLLPEFEDSSQEDTNNTIHYESDDESAQVINIDRPSRSDGGTGGTLRQIKSEIEVESYAEEEEFLDTDELFRRETEHDLLQKITRKEENDSDRLFLMSLVPCFKRIHPRKKLSAKIEIMKLIESYQED